MLYAGASDRRRISMVDDVAVLDAFREGKLLLPPGYTVEYGADVLLLRRSSGSVVAAFNAGKVLSSEVERDAWEDHKRSIRQTA
jgi:hypothetical protein